MTKAELSDTSLEQLKQIVQELEEQVAELNATSLEQIVQQLREEAMKP